VRMPKVRARLDLAQKPLGADCLRHVGPQDLDGHPAMVAHVARFVDAGHPARAHFALDFVTALQARTQRIENFGHGASDRSNWAVVRETVQQSRGVKNESWNRERRATGRLASPRFPLAGRATYSSD